MGPVQLQITKLQTLIFETAIIERYKRRESSMEEFLIEMYLASISVWRAEDITEVLWGTRASSVTDSNLNKEVYEQIKQWINTPDRR